MPMSDRSRVDVTADGTTVTATDAANNRITFDVSGWDPNVTPVELDDPVDQVVAGRLTSLQYDLTNILRITRLDGEFSLPDCADDQADAVCLYSDDVAAELPPGAYRCSLHTDMFVTLQFEGPASIAKQPFGPVSIQFAHPTPVTFGFKTMVDVPGETVIVEPTVSGIATGISHLSAAFDTHEPARIHRNYRGYPPLVELGETTAVPPAVRKRRLDTDLEFVVPDTLEAVFSASSLTYLTGATLRPEAGVTPRLERADGPIYEFSSSNLFAREALRLLERVFYLELLCSWQDDESPTLVAEGPIKDAGIDLAAIADEPLGARVERYLDLPAECHEAVLPPWPYRIALEPEPASVESLSHLLCDMAAIVPPGDGNQAETADAGTVSVALANNRQVRGALGTAETPLNYTALPIAYENRVTARERSKETLRVAVVVSAEAATTLGSAIRERYNRRDESRTPMVELVVEPDCAELSAVFASGPDLVHFIGDCSNGGFACADGTLAPADIEDNAADVVLLDGTTETGAGEPFDGLDRALLETGSVCVVTRDGASSDEMETNHATATTPGETSTLTRFSSIGELALYGQSVSTAATCAHIQGGRPVTRVLGDGSHRFVAMWKPASIWVCEGTSGEQLDLTMVSFPVDPVGAQWFTGTPAIDKHFLSSVVETSCDPTAFADFLEEASSPIYYDDRLYWPEESFELAYPLL